MDDVRKLPNFYQTKQNVAKMGAYYTDPYHCQLIRQMLDFSEDEVCCLEPSIGDGRAIIEVTQKEINANIKIFGVEINEDTYHKNIENSKIDYQLQADFLEEVMISHNAFSFCFSNPPYGTLESGEREEVAFLKKLLPYLTNQAVIVFVIPLAISRDTKFIHVWCNFFTTLEMYKFKKEEFKKYKQVVLIGKRGKEEENTYLSKMEQLNEIPDRFYGSKIKIMSSLEAKVQLFTTKDFQPEKVIQSIKNSPLIKLMQERTSIPTYAGSIELGKPPVMPKDSHLYLLATCGLGQGLVGTEESHDLHLQRGIVKNISEKRYISEDDGEKMVLVETQHSSIAYKVIESDGEIQELI